LLTVALPSGTPSLAVIESKLSQVSSAWLWESRVGGRYIMPCAALLELVCAGVRSLAAGSKKSEGPLAVCNAAMRGVVTLVANAANPTADFAYKGKP
jgi:hypothetical protein